MINRMSINGILKLQELEGLRLLPYQDAGGKWTIGYGHLIKPGENYLMNGITKEQAHDLFNHDIVPFMNRINENVTVPLTQNQYDALVMWDFNTGKAHESDLIKLINAGSPINQIIEWWSNHYTSANGIYNKGIKKRRIYEANLFAGVSPHGNELTTLIAIAIGSFAAYELYKVLR